MDVRTTQTITNLIYSVRFDLTFTDADNKLINSFGDPSVEYGGVITWDDDSNDTTPEVTLFTLPSNPRTLRAGTGWTQRFDGSSDPDALLKATNYARIINDRLAASITTLRSNSDTFSTVKTETT